MSNKTLLQNAFEELLTTITPGKILKEQCHVENSILTIAQTHYDLKPYSKVHLLGSGKAVIPMATAMQGILGNHCGQTTLVGAYALDDTLKETTYLQSTHPIPTQKSLDAGELLRNTLESFKEDELFIYLLSGGNSALVELPETGITLGDFQEATSLMIRGGMPIESINSVRKHLSQVKGGKLGSATKAKGIVLVLSDVVGDDLHTIGSAPFYYDPSSYADAITALESHHLFEKMPSSIQTFLAMGKEGHYLETPKSENPNITHHIIGSNRHVLQKMSDILRRSGVETTIIQEPFTKEVSELSKDLMTFAKRHQESRHCYIFGGESTVHVTGKGKGGRNQHLCLHFFTLLDGTVDVTFLSAATDGVDGNSDAAGALIDMHSPYNVELRNVDPIHYLKTFDSNTFFNKSDELIVTGPTHNNLLDIVVMLIEPTIL